MSISARLRSSFSNSAARFPFCLFHPTHSSCSAAPGSLGATSASARRALSVNASLCKLKTRRLTATRCGYLLAAQTLIHTRVSRRITFIWSMVLSHVLIGSELNDSNGRRIIVEVCWRDRGGESRRLILPPDRLLGKNQRRFRSAWRAYDRRAGAIGLPVSGREHDFRRIGCLDTPSEWRAESRSAREASKIDAALPTALRRADSGHLFAFCIRGGTAVTGSEFFDSRR